MLRRYFASTAWKTVARWTCALGGLWMGLCTLAYFFQERLLFHPLPIPPDVAYPFERPYEERTLPVDGAALAVVRFPLPNPRGAVLCLHGNAENLWGAERFAEAFAKYGYEVWAYDYRGYGKSTGHISSEAQLHADAAAVYAVVREKFPADRVVLFGSSLGTGLVSRCAADHPPGLLLLEAPYASIAEVAATHYPWAPTFLLKYPLRTDAIFRTGKIACPIHILHGRRDEIIPYAQAERLAACVEPPAVLHDFPTGGHNDLMQFPQYRFALDEIFARLPPRPAGPAEDKRPDPETPPAAGEATPAP